jgi:hypothetical protein
MEPLNPNKTGLVLGAFVGGWHVLWALLVALGWAQAVVNFVFWIHFLKPVFSFEPFSAGMALMLILLASAIGYLVGYVLGVLWNWVHR